MSDLCGVCVSLSECVVLILETVWLLNIQYTIQLISSLSLQILEKRHHIDRC